MKNLKSIFLKTECSQALCKQTKSVSPGQLSPLAHDSATCGWDEGVSLWAPLPCPPVLPRAAAEAAPDLPETQPCRPPPQVPGGQPRADRPLSHLPGSLGSARGDPSSRPAPRLPNSGPRSRAPPLAGAKPQTLDRAPPPDPKAEFCGSGINLWERRG